MIRTGTLCLASNKCQPTRLPGQSAPKCIQMIFEHLSLSFSRHKSCILKTARPPSLPLICFVNLSLHTLQAHPPSLVFCVHISIWWSSLLSETIDSFWFFLFFFFASLLPRHPPSFFSKVFLFREMIAPWDIVWQTGRQTEQVFFFPLSLSFSVSDFRLKWVKFLPTHHHSTCQCRLDDEEASVWVCSFAISIVFLSFFSDCLWNFAYQFRKTGPTSQAAVQKENKKF